MDYGISNKVCFYVDKAEGTIRREFENTRDNLPYEKAGNNEPICIADEVPFEIPDSW